MEKSQNNGKYNILEFIDFYLNLIQSYKYWHFKYIHKP